PAQHAATRIEIVNRHLDATSVSLGMQRETTGRWGDMGNDDRSDWLSTEGRANDASMGRCGPQVCREWHSRDHRQKEKCNRIFE
ncbi:MAG TPA: hypothetical protein VIM63_18200, partial [Rhodoferax sp.]